MQDSRNEEPEKKRPAGETNPGKTGEARNAPKRGADVEDKGRRAFGRDG
jgi:hypothetical protein